jgi:hypothetical protein
VLTVLVPSLVLDYLSTADRLGPFGALVVSMFFPIGFGLWCWWNKAGWNLFSILGFVTVLLSGGLGLLKLDAFWFAVKESAMPVMLGAAFPMSHIWGRPLINALILQPHLINQAALSDALGPPQKKLAFEAALHRASWMLGGGMILSACGNFFLALWLLGGKEPGSEAFVKGIGTLNWAGLVVLGVPLMLIMLAVFIWLLRRIQTITGLEKVDLMTAGRTVRRQVGD